MGIRGAQILPENVSDYLLTRILMMMILKMALILMIQLLSFHMSKLVMILYLTKAAIFQNKKIWIVLALF